MPPTTPPLRGRIAIFDDEPNMGRILVKTLGLEGFEANAFTNPVEGLQALPRLQPDVLLTDMRMPEMNGLQVLKRMREDLDKSRRELEDTRRNLDDLSRDVKGGRSDTGSRGGSDGGVKPAPR